jgi:hypothetical protein
MFWFGLQFSYVPATERAESRGASHSAELPYAFDSWSKFAPASNLTDEARAVTRTLHSCWVSFAKAGKPQCENAPEWPRLSVNDDTLMDFDVTAKVKQHVRKAQLDAQIATMRDNIAEQKSSFDGLSVTVEKMLRNMSQQGTERQKLKGTTLRRTVDPECSLFQIASLYRVGTTFCRVGQNDGASSQSAENAHQAGK